MTLFVTLVAAIISTIVWYFSKTKHNGDKYKLISLIYMYWGASLMWLIDFIIEYANEGSKVFMPEVVENNLEATLLNQQIFFHESMNDLILGLICVALGLIVFLAILIIRDPNKVIWKKK